MHILYNVSADMRIGILKAHVDAEVTLERRSMERYDQCGTRVGPLRMHGSSRGQTDRSCHDQS